jgi:hypothetical protein
MNIEVFNGRIGKFLNRNVGGILIEVVPTFDRMEPTVFINGKQVTGPVNGQPEGTLRPTSGVVNVEGSPDRIVDPKVV